jgi:surface antigen
MQDFSREPFANAQLDRSDTRNDLSMSPLQEVRLPVMTTGERNTEEMARSMVIIPGDITMRSHTSRVTQPSKRRRLFIHAIVCAVLVIIVCGTFLAVSPVSTHGQTGLFGAQNPLLNVKSSKQGNTALIRAQAATATAVLRDGYAYQGPDQASVFAMVNANVPKQGYDPALAGTINYPYAQGQCVYWADYRYHALTGYYEPWVDNASGWAADALNYPGWIVSSQPHVPSILVLQPGVQGALQFGHVAVVESINPDGTVYTSAWNYVAPGILSYVTYHTGSGALFVWHE